MVQAGKVFANGGVFVSLVLVHLRTTVRRDWGNRFTAQLAAYTFMFL